MSFILDALKKLEQKRQKGTVPDLMTIHAPERQKERRAIWPYLVMGALILNVGILAAIFRPWEADIKKPVVQASAEQLRKEAPVQQFVKKSEPTSALPQIKKSSAAPDKKPIVPKVSSVSVNKATEIKKAAPAPKQDNPPSPVEVKIYEPRQIEEAYDNNKPSSDGGSPEALSMNPSQHEMETLRNKIKEETYHSGNKRSVKETPDKNEEADSDYQVPDFSQLPEETRKELPDITISTHIYSNNPRSRIVNINGSTIKEGDEVIRGLKIREITMSGVIFDYQGRLFQVRAF
ncbi:MAG: general secretion pathway protein GspB [Nitrospirae bacterium]|nr:general secretion pathway protein GspB [Nitrospirota bacterium]